MLCILAGCKLIYLIYSSEVKKSLFLLILLFSVLWLHSQSLNHISGTVTGNTGPVKGADLHLLNTSLQASTDASGRFDFHSIGAGTYRLSIEAAGYAEQVISVALPLSSPLQIELRSSGRQLDEVVVTAQKAEQQLQHIPLSVTALNARQVQDDKLWDAKDITALVPNLYSANPGDNRNVTSIRGITTTSYSPAVATYVDGVNQFNLDTYLSPLLDIERIEVLRGPQGTLYGRNALGGVINIITRQPDNTTRGFVQADWGNYGLQRYSLGLSAPIIKNKLFLGGAGLFSGFNGFYTNLYTHSNFDKQHYFLGNYYLKYLINSHWNINLNFKNYESRNQGAFPLAGSVADALAQPFTVNQNATTTMVDNTLNASLSVNHTGPYFDFSSQTAYQQNYRYYRQPIDGDFSPADAVAVVNNYGSAWNKVKTFTQEFRFTSPSAPASKLTWVAGAYGFISHSPDKQGTYFGDDAGLEGSPITDFTSININRGKTYGLAFYGQATYPILPKLNLTAGLRYDAEHAQQTVEGLFQANGQPAMITQADTSARAGFHALSPAASLAWQMAPQNLLYGSYNRGFRSGGISELSSDPSQPPLRSFLPEHSNSFEIGLKNSFYHGLLRWNLAVFYTNVNDAQVPTLILPDAITVTRNAGRLHSRGIETELAATPFSGLELSYAFGYTHARYKDLMLSSNGSAVNLDGNHQVFTPDITSMFIAQYSYAVSRQIKLIGHAEWRYLGSQYFDLANQIEQKGYSVFNFRLGAATQHYQFFAWSSNLFNKHYFDYAYDFGAVHYGNPRTYGVTLRASF